MQLVVHGGAGSMPARRRGESDGSAGGEPDEPDARQGELEAAAEAGAREPTPLDAVVTALSALEDSPRFNAGVGGAVQADGAVRVDAGVMTGDREVGAVCAVPGVARPTAVARAVLERTPHVLVAGQHAVRLAETAGVETGVDLLTATTRERYAAADPPAGVADGGDVGAALEWVPERFGADDAEGRPPGDHDTVGAVAVADDGALAAATSTGGRWFALPGRVGDSPQVGSGFYAGPAGGASATGHGEEIARLTGARLAVDRLEDGDDPDAAAEHVVATLGRLTGGNAGIVVADAAGRVGSAHNTDGMQTATARR